MTVTTDSLPTPANGLSRIEEIYKSPVTDKRGPI